jgi:filamentous hemagglutinin
MPAENVANADFIETATLKPRAKFVTRVVPVVPGVGTNPGGGIEAVVDPGGVDLQSFSTGTPGEE